MTNLFFSDLTTNKSFSIVNSYREINKFRQNRRSTWPNFPVQKKISLLLHSQQECINKTALPYRSSWHELISAFPHHCPKSSFGGLPSSWHRRSTSFRAPLLHEDDPLDSLQHHEQWGVRLTTGFACGTPSPSRRSTRSRPRTIPFCCYSLHGEGWQNTIPAARKKENRWSEPISYFKGIRCWTYDSWTWRWDCTGRLNDGRINPLKGAYLPILLGFLLASLHLSHILRARGIGFGWAMNPLALTYFSGNSSSLLVPLLLLLE